MTWQTELKSWLSPPSVQTAETPTVSQKAPPTPKLNIPAKDGRPTVISFLRHCGCPFAEKTFLNMRDMAAAHRDVDWVAVSHSEQGATERWLVALPEPEKNTQPNLHVIVDAEREAYGAWGLGISSLWHVLGSIPGTTKLKQEGISVRATESGSRWQTAGNFGIDGEGTVKWARVDQRADDMPDFKQGLDAVLGGRFEQAGVAEAMQG